VYDVVVQKVHVRYLISWWVSCYYMQFPLHAFSCTCPFSEHFTLRIHYTPFPLPAL